MRVVKMNLSFTILYNLVGLTLAALGLLRPILAAAAQSLPDLRYSCQFVAVASSENSQHLVRDCLFGKSEAPE